MNDIGRVVEALERLDLFFTHSFIRFQGLRANHDHWTSSLKMSSKCQAKYPIALSTHENIMLTLDTFKLKLKAMSSLCCRHSFICSLVCSFVRSFVRSF